MKNSALARLVSIPIILLFSVFILMHGFQVFATLQESKHIFGSLFEHYKLTKEAYLIFKFLMVVILIMLVILQAKILLRNKHKIRKSFLIFYIALICTWIFSELMLQYLYVGKG